MRKWPLMEEAGTGSAGGAAGSGAGTGTSGTAGTAGAGATGTTGSGQTGTTGTGATVTTWPTDWRKQLAGGDEKEAARLERFATPNDVWKMNRSFESRLSSGELKSTKPYPEKGTAEEQNAWRKEQGIPESYDKYDLTFDDGLVVGEEDKPVVEHFLKAFHAAHTPPAVVKQAVRAYYELQDQQAEARAAKDKEGVAEFEKTMSAEWGKDYGQNKNLIRGLLATGPDGIAEKIFASRLPDGTAFGNSPDVARFLIQLAREINPPTTLTGGDMSPDAVVDEIASIEKEMGNKQSDYWKGPKDANGETKLQVRYRQLVSARDRKR